MTSPPGPRRLLQHHEFCSVNDQAWRVTQLDSSSCGRQLDHRNVTRCVRLTVASVFELRRKLSEQSATATATCSYRGLAIQAHLSRRAACDATKAAKLFISSTRSAFSASNAVVHSALSVVALSKALLSCASCCSTYCLDSPRDCRIDHCNTSCSAVVWSTCAASANALTSKSS